MSHFRLGIQTFSGDMKERLPLLVQFLIALIACLLVFVFTTGVHF